MKNNKKLKVSIVMGSQSDHKTMKLAVKIIKSLGIKFETKIISAHRTPKRMFEYASSADRNNIGVIIAGAGGSAHLPGMISALTTIPVLGVPIESKKLKGLDSLLSIAQMPKGIPVGTLAIGEDGAINAALLAASIVANCNPIIKKKIPELLILFVDIVSIIFNIFFILDGNMASKRPSMKKSNPKAVTRSLIFLISFF